MAIYILYVLLYIFTIRWWWRKMKYHGNYCGPFWSAGKHQESVDSDFPSIDDFDESCRTHDRHYAIGADLYEADKTFALENIKRPGIKPKLAALAVGAQAVSRKPKLRKQKDSSKMPTSGQIDQWNPSDPGPVNVKPPPFIEIVVDGKGGTFSYGEPKTGLVAVPGYAGLYYNYATKQNEWASGYGSYLVNGVTKYGKIPVSQPKIYDTPTMTPTVQYKPTGTQSNTFGVGTIPAMLGIGRNTFSNGLAYAPRYGRRRGRVR